MTAHGPERRGPERAGPDYPREWDGEPEESAMDGERHELPGQPTPHACQSCGHPINCQCATRPSADTETLRARINDALDALSRETGAYEAGYKGWAQQVIRQVRAALDDPA